MRRANRPRMRAMTNAEAGEEIDYQMRKKGSKDAVDSSQPLMRRKYTDNKVGVDVNDQKDAALITDHGSKRTPWHRVADSFAKPRRARDKVADGSVVVGLNPCQRSTIFTSWPGLSQGWPDGGLKGDPWRRRGVDHGRPRCALDRRPSVVVVGFVFPVEAVFARREAEKVLACRA